MVQSENSVMRYRAGYGLVVLTLFFFRLWFAGTLPLSGDETYHWEWSRHLAFGYYDHPGLTAYLIRLSTFLFGGSTETSVRFVALAMLTLTSVIGYLLARDVTADRGGSAVQAERAAFVAGLLLLVVPIYAAFSVYISTDPPVIFFWTLSVYLLYRAYTRGTYASWILAGTAIGFALMSKFLAFFILPAAFLFMVISRTDRKWFGQWQMIAAAGACLLVVSPFVWWNMQHDWATFMFNFVYRQEQTGIHPLNALEYVGGQMLAISPVIFAGAVASLVYAMKTWRTAGDRASLFIGLTSIVPLLYFTYVGFRRQVGLHWPTPGWVGALILWACYSSMDWAESRRARRTEQIGIGFAIVLVVVLHLVIHIPQRWIESSWHYWGDPERINLEKSAERYGWRELGQKVSEVRKELLGAQKEPRGLFVITDQYGLSASVAFYTPEQLETHLWVTRKVHGENYRFWDKYPALKGQDAIFVTKSEENAIAAAAQFRQYFESRGGPERFDVKRDGKRVRSFYLVRCNGFKGVVPDFMNQ